MYEIMCCVELKVRQMVKCIWYTNINCFYLGVLGKVSKVGFDFSGAQDKRLLFLTLF
jgi:hypothetical protein